MERYLGLDVHAASSTLAVISEAGRQLQTHVLETNWSSKVIASVSGRAGARSWRSVGTTALRRSS